MSGQTHTPAPFRVRWVEKLQRRLAARGYQLSRVCEDEPAGFAENADPSSLKFAERLAESAVTGALESPEERVLEMAAAHFVADATRIVCVGQGTGVFEAFVSVDAALEIVGVVRDPEALRWCREQRVASNVSFTDCDLAQLVEQDDEFDLALVLGVIDQTADFGGFLEDLARLAPRAVISVGNRARDRRVFSAPRPANPSARREWTAGELYWVLRTCYRDVELYGLADPCVPRLERVNLFSDLPVLYAVCAN